MIEGFSRDEGSLRGYIEGSVRLFAILVVVVGFQYWVVGLPEELEPWHAFVVAGAVVGVGSMAGAALRAFRRARSAGGWVGRPSKGVGIALSNLDGRVLTSNRTFQEMLGYSEDEISGRPVSDFTVSGETSEVLAHLRALADGRCDQYETDRRYRRKDGKVVRGHVTVSCLRDATGHPQYAVGIVEPLCPKEEITPGV